MVEQTATLSASAPSALSAQVQTLSIHTATVVRNAQHIPYLSVCTSKTTSRTTTEEDAASGGSGAEGVQLRILQSNGCLCPYPGLDMDTQDMLLQSSKCWRELVTLCPVFAEEMPS
ncbi:Late embryogenesis abundant protein 32 [Dissostichus eleginoides]|uniref:Late embryogenesis abundant protein 32 n=1 Tax=Dissostichus eleginoides TaxID=100907 RepID=A0AAD9EZR4_DISEL|nr:Late embryogenesis abundant protein 32 [Dissostichus eleginoides]